MRVCGSIKNAVFHYVCHMQYFSICASQKIGYHLLAEPSFSFVGFMWFNIQHSYMQIREVMVELSINIPFIINAEKIKPI